MRRLVATSAWRPADVARRGSDVAAATRVARALQRVCASRAASTSSGSGPPAFDWDDDDKVGSLRSKVRRALAASRARPDDRAASGASASSSAPASLGWFGPNDRPAPWDAQLMGTKTTEGVFEGVSGVGGAERKRDARVSDGVLSRRSRGVSSVTPAYDPKAFTEYFLYRRPLRALLRTTEILARLADVGARVALKKGTIEDRAARLRGHFAKLGPAFVKLGQVLSTRADFLPPSYCFELTKLQENVEPSSFEHAEALVRRELGVENLEDVFKDGLPKIPVAAASLAMVYRADLAVEGGPAVAVKVQRPFLAESVALDATILRGIALALRYVFGLRSDVVGVVDELVGNIFGELDYREERNAVERFRATYARGGGSGADLAGKVRAPRVLPELSTERVLVMEWVHGARLTDASEVRSSAVLLERGVRCSLHQLLETGFMHADPHPGNLVVDARTGALTYLDFGMTVHVDARRRRAMLRGLVGFVNRDARSLVRDLVELEFLPPSVDVEAATSALADVFDGVERETQTKTKNSKESAKNVRAKNVRGTNDFLGVVSQLGAALYAHEFRLPPYFARVLRALAALEGVAVGVDADFKVIERVYPYVLARLVRDPDPETRETLKRLVLAPDGESVRWRRVARVFSAVADGFKRRNPKTKKGPPRDEEKDDVSSGTTREFSTRAFPFPFRCGEDVADVAKKVAETALALAEGADELARDGCARDGPSAAIFSRRRTDRDAFDGTPGTGTDDGDDTALAASAVRDAMEHVMSPAGTRLRAALVRDALEACDDVFFSAPLANDERRNDEARGARSRAADVSSDETTDTDERSFREKKNERLELDPASLLALADSAREVYVAAPRTWAPVIAATAAKPGAAEMSFSFGRGIAERATRENARRAAKAALKAFEKAL